MQNTPCTRQEWEVLVKAKWPTALFKHDGLRMYAVVQAGDVGMHSVVLAGGWVKEPSNK